MFKKIFMLVSLAAMSVAYASECDTFAPNSGPTAITSMGDDIDTVDVTRKFSTGVPVDFKVNDQIVYRKTVKVANHALFESPLELQRPGIFSTTHKFEADRKYPVIRIRYQGQNYKAVPIHINNKPVNTLLTINDRGESCDTMAYKDFITDKKYTFAGTPKVQLVKSEVPGSEEALVIALSGIGPVSLDFVVNKISNGSLGQEKKFSFDKNADVVRISGYTMKINSVSANAVNLTLVSAP